MMGRRNADVAQWLLAYVATLLPLEKDQPSEAFWSSQDRKPSDRGAHMICHCGNAVQLLYAYLAACHGGAHRFSWASAEMKSASLMKSAINEFWVNKWRTRYHKLEARSHYHYQCSHRPKHASAYISLPPCLAVVSLALFETHEANKDYGS